MTKREIAELAAAMLTDEGYKVILARDGFEALKIYQQISAANRSCHPGFFPSGDGWRRRFRRTAALESKRCRGSEQRLRRAKQVEQHARAGSARVHSQSHTRAKNSRPGPLHASTQRKPSGAIDRVQPDAAECTHPPQVNPLRWHRFSFVKVAPMARIDSFFKLMAEQKASDLHLSTNNPPMLRINGELVRVDYPAAGRTTN